MSSHRKMHKRGRSNKRNTNTKKNTTKRLKGGDCGCSKLMNGGDFFNKGYEPNPSFNALPIHSFYSQNLYKSDVQGGQQSSRLDVQASTMKGGKKQKKNKKTKRTNTKTRKTRGGMNLYPVSSNLVQSTNSIPPLNMVTSAGDIPGSLMGYNISRGGVMDYSNPVLVNSNNIGKGAMV